MAHGRKLLTRPQRYKKAYKNAATITAFSGQAVLLTYVFCVRSSGLTQVGAIVSMGSTSNYRNHQIILYYVNDVDCVSSSSLGA